jgi:hypothetical protein
MSFNTFYLNSGNTGGIIDGSNVVIGGKIGVLTDTPQYALDVSGTSRSIKLFATTAIIDNLEISGETVDINSIQTKVEGTQTCSFNVLVDSKTSNAANIGGSSSGYFINNIETPFIHLTPGKTYRFVQSDSTNSSHPILFYLDETKSSQYSTGVTTSGSAGQSSAYVEIQVTHNTPEILYYQCQNHAYMGNKLYVKSSNVTTITSVGTVTSGTWNAVPIEKQYINTQSISINDLSDVSFNSTDISDNQTLTWNTTNQTWGPSTSLINLKPTITIPEMSSGNILLNFTEGIKDVATYDKDDFVLTNEGTVISSNSIGVENNKVKFAFGVVGHDWTEDTSVGATKNWKGITSSADGTTLAAVHYGGNIWTSNDSGVTWTEVTVGDGTNNWNGITSSADGTKLAAAGSNTNIWTSSNSGANWTEDTSVGATKSWQGITSSSVDGTKLAVGAFGGNIWTSSDSGATWTEVTVGDGTNNWYDITTSSDGTKLAAVARGLNIWTSSNSGATWTVDTIGATKNWYGITSSSDGTKLAAVVKGGNIWTSNNSGATWTENTVGDGTNDWREITSSTDGTKLAASAYPGNIWTSSDSGGTWTEDTTVNATKNWQGITSSADGTKLVATVYGGNIWTKVASIPGPTITDVQNLTVKYTKSATANKNLLGKDSDVAVDTFDFVGTNRTQANITSTVDVSMNNLWVEGDISCNSTLKVDTINENTDTSGVTIDSVLLKDNTVTAHTVTAQNYSVGGTNFISASRQGNFRDLEVKNSSNSATILLTGDGGDISIDGTLSTDNISENTDTSGVTIDGVLLKDGSITATGITQSAGDNTTQLATTQFVSTAVSNLVNGAPGALDTLSELASALDNSGNFATNVTNTLGSLQTQIDTKQATLTFNDPSSNNTNPSTSAQIKTALDAKQDTLTAGTNITITGTTISASGGGGGSAIDQTTDVSLNDLTIHGDISGSASSSIKFDGGTQITETNTKLKSWVIDNSGSFDISHVGYQSSGSEGTTWPKPRQEHSTIMDNSNNIIIFGGKDSGSNHLSDIWEYDIDTNTYTKKVTTLQTTGASSIKPTYSSDNTWLPYENLTTTGFKSERSDNRSMVAYDDKVYYLTDTQLWVKDLTVTVSSPSTAGNTNWSQVTGITGTAPNNSKRGAFFYHNDSGTDYLYYLFGVWDDDTSPESSDFNTSAYRYNISTKTWSSTSVTNSTTNYKRMYSAFHVYDGYCFSYGGNVNGSNYSNTFVKVGLGGSGDKTFGYCSTLSPSTESGSNSITGRTYVSWAGQNEYMFIVGGRASNGNTQKCIFRYDCANNTYRQITSTSDSIVGKLHWEEGVAGIYDNKIIMASSYNAGTSGATNYLLSVDISTTSNSYSLAYYPDGSSQTDASRRINTQANNSVGAAAAWVVYKNRWYFMFSYGTGINSDGSYSDSIDYSNGFGGGISPYMWTYVFADYSGTTTYDLVNHTSSLHDNNMYIFGGKNSSNTYANNLLRVALSNYTFSSLTVSSLPSIRDSHSSAPLNDKIYIFGGWDGSTVNNETWELDLSTDPPTSTQKQSNVISSVNINRYGHSAVIYDGNMYIFGGHDGTNLYNTIYKYDITNNSWSLMTTNGTSPSVRYYHTAFVTKDEMIVYGGKDAANATIQDSFLFDFSNSTWYNLNDDATTTHTPTSASIPNYSFGADAIHYNSGNDYKIYLYGGYNSQNTTLLGGNGIIQVTDISHNLTEYVTSEVGIAFTFNTDNTGKVGIGKLIPTKTLDVGGDINFSGSLYQNGSVVNIGSSTFNQNTDLTINSLTTINDISFSGNLYQNGSLFTGIDVTSNVSLNNMDISGVLATNKSNNQISLGAHIIPTSNETFDLGNAEYKIRHLFLSDNSLWVGDDHKIDISGGKMKFKKRKKTAIPTNISALGGSHADINYIVTNTAGVSNIEEMTLQHWHDYVIQNNLNIAGKGVGNASIEDIFSSNQSGDWDKDDELDTWTTNSSDIYYSTGKVGIGTDTPVCALHVESSTNIDGFPARGYLGSGGAGSTSSTSSTAAVSIKASSYIWGETDIIASSDRRIKSNIVDVSDNQALSMVRSIPCRYYEYKDKVSRGTEKTIGFIAQEVREVLPMAVILKTHIIPNEMRKLVDISWNNTTLYTDLSDCSGIKYRFYVSNSPSGVDEVQKEIIGNEDNSFTFDQSWNSVFCYGKKIDDFHTVDKNKLFALNFSATQELDKLVQSQQQEIEHLKLVNQDINSQLNTAISELQTIKHYLGI